MSTVMDNANILANSIRESKEYLEYKEIKAKIFSDADLKKLVEEFEKIRYEEQLLELQGEKQSVEKMQKLQELYNVLVQDNDVKDFFEKEVKFNLLIADVNKTIGDSIKDVLA